MKTAAIALLALSLTAPVLAQTDRISAPALRDLQRTEKRLKIFDARNKTSYEDERIAGAVLPLSDDYYRLMEMFRLKVIPKAPDADAALADAVKDLPRDTPVVTYCSKNCSASRIMAERLEKLGFTDARWLEDGIQAWKEAGYPVETEKALGL